MITTHRGGPDKLLDARGAGALLPSRCDVLIVGAGPAGVAAARRLSGHGLGVVVLEAGGEVPTAAGQRALAGERSGSPYWDLQNTRYLGLGGSANRWGGISRPLDPIDFEARDWVADSGWPVDAAALRPYYAAAGQFLELPTGTFTAPAVDDRATFAGDDVFDLVGYEISPMIRFGRRVQPGLAACPDVTVVLNAFVDALVPAADEDRIDRVEVRSPGGGRFTVRPRVVLLCAGAIENARLLLASRTRRAHGLGNEHDQVGRYFMEHIHAPIADLYPSAKAQHWSTYDLSNPAQPRMRSAFTVSEQAARADRLLSASVSVGPATYGAVPPFISWFPGLTLLLERGYVSLEERGGVAGAAADRVLNLSRTAWGAASTIRRRRASTGPAGTVSGGSAGQPHSVYIRGEQVPLASNRVTLGRGLDALGRQRAALHWEVDEQSRVNSERVLARFAAMTERRGLGRVTGPLPDWETQIVGGPHHMGTTRMSATPADGVVDATGRVHNLKNLYVGGGSVFRTGGHANPTLTVVALALLAADAVRDRAHGLSAPEPNREQEVSQPS